MTATFPQAIKVFTTFHNYTDIIWAQSINEIHDEVHAIESLLGVSPFANTPYTTVGGAISDLYNNKAPITHTHMHKELLDDNQGNDHPQYIMVNGYPGFSQPVAGRAGSNPADLVPLSQLQAMGYQNAAQVEAMVQAALGNLMAGGKGGPPLYGNANAAPNWRVQGGLHSSMTDANGYIVTPVSFNPHFTQTVQGFASTKLPPQRPYGGTPYNWIEAQMTLTTINFTEAIVQFSHDYSWQGNQWVSFSYVVIGV